MPATADASVLSGGLRRRTCLVTTGVLCLGLPTRVTAQSSEDEQAVHIERAAFQRALSQRMAKAYLMLAQGIEPALAGRILDEARSTFVRHLALLTNAAPSAEAARQLAVVAERWVECRAVLQKPPSRAGAGELYTLNDELQAAAHSALLAFEGAYRSPALRGLMLAGRLRMLGERMAKFWLYRHWKLNAEPADMELHLARAHFTAILLQVEKLDLAPAAVAAAAALRTDWPTYDRLLQGTRGVSPAELARSSEQVFAGGQALVRQMLPPGRVPAAPASSAPAGPR